MPRPARNSTISAQDFSLTPEGASQLAEILLRCVRTEYPNYPAHLLLGPEDVTAPKILHPAFYGCYDWHSAVHSHWSLVHLINLNLFECDDEVLSILHTHLSEENIFIERSYFDHPERKGFERPYGWAWLLMLASELATGRKEEARQLARHLAPLEQFVVHSFFEFLPEVKSPNRSGLHGNTAFSLGLLWDYAVRVGNHPLIDLARETAGRLYQADEHASLEREPGPTDFLSPSLVQADLFRRILIGEEFDGWFRHFIGGFDFSKLNPVYVSDRSDGALCHLDGLNLSRAWCLRNIAETLGAKHPLYEPMKTCALAHAEEGLAHVASGYFVGEHWLPTFAVYLLRRTVSLGGEGR